jgi:hypothetical protein
MTLLPRSSGGVLVALVAIVVCSGFLFTSGARDSAFPQRQSQPSDPVNESEQKALLVPSVCEFDFGTLPKGSQHGVNLWLHNPGSSELVIAQVKTSCECFQVKLSQDVIEPGKKVAATAEVDFRDDPGFTGRLRLKATGLAGQEATVAFTIYVTVTVR